MLLVMDNALAYETTYYVLFTSLMEKFIKQQFVHFESLKVVKVNGHYNDLEILFMDHSNRGTLFIKYDMV